MSKTIYDIKGEQIPFFGIENSSMNVKWNRIARIGKNYNSWFLEMENFIRENKSFPTTKNYNFAVAFLTIMETGIRVGNEDSAEGFYSEYKEEGKRVLAHTYGLTTLEPRHIEVVNGKVRLDFTGKKHVQNTFQLNQKLSDLTRPIIESGYDPVYNMEEGELTRFIKSKTSKHLSTKDFRTFRANVLAFQFSKKQSEPTTKKERREAISATLELVAEQLNNTKGVVKSSYVDPELLDFLFPEIIEES